MTQVINSNLLTVVIIAGFAILLGFFAWQFGSNGEKSANNIAQTSRETSASINATVNKAVDNVTTAFLNLVELKQSEVDLLRNLSLTLMEEREASKANIALFLDTIGNQSAAEVNATQQLQETVVQTLEKSQNLTQLSQNLTQERIDVERDTNDKLEELVINFIGNKTNN